jgi:uncharacterized paraquat-inducible protein A
MTVNVMDTVTDQLTLATVMRYYRLMTWLDEFEADLLKMVQQDNPEATSVVGWDEDSRSGGFCETCYYDETIVEVTFTCTSCHEPGHFMRADTHTWTWTGGLAELMRELVRER